MASPGAMLSLAGGHPKCPGNVQSLYASSRGGIKSDSLGEEDVAQLFNALALKLAERASTTPDSDTSLTLVYVMKGRPDLCAKYFAAVPNGLRDRTSQAT